MKKVERFIFGALFLVVLFIPWSSQAQSPFDGAWHINMNQSKVSPKRIVAFLSEGWYHCATCNPQLDVRANGQDQAVVGQAFDAISVKEIDSRTIQIVTKKGNAAVYEQTRTASSDGKTLTIKTTKHPVLGGPPVITEVVATRTGTAPANLNPTSGSWLVAKVQLSDNRLLITYKTAGDQITMSGATGRTYTGKFDGKDYPVKSAFFYNTVSLKRIDSNTMEETYKRDGTVVKIVKVTVSPDGKKMTLIDTNTLTDSTSTYVATRL